MVQNAFPSRRSSPLPPLRVSLLACWLTVGVAFHLIYHGLPHPLALRSWFYILAWPLPVMAGMLRWVFMPFAAMAFICFLAVFLVDRRRPKA